MPSIRHKSKPARPPLVLLAMLFTFLAVIAVRPAAGLAPPEGEPPAAEEPRPPQLAFQPGGYDFRLQPVNNRPNQPNFELRHKGSQEVHVDYVAISPSRD